MTNKHKSQQILSAPTKFSDKIISNEEHYFSKMAPAKKLILNELIGKSSQYVDIWISQSTMGKSSSVTREYANRVIKEFERDGILNKQYRHMTTCLYKLNSIFNDYEMRKKLSIIFPALRLIPFVWMFSCQTANITEVINLNLVFSSSYSLCNNLSSDTQVSKKLRARVRGGQGEEIKKPKKEVVVIENPINQSIKDIIELKLTKWGQIRLMCFPDEAIRYAREKCKFANIDKIRNPFAWFFAMADEYCAMHSIRPDFSASQQLAQLCNQPENAKLLIEDKIIGEKKPFNKYSKKEESTTVVLSSIERLNIVRDIEKKKIIPTNDAKIAEIKQELEKTQTNLTHLADNMFTEFTRQFMIDHIRDLHYKLSLLEVD
jgi:hypothetical protein